MSATRQGRLRQAGLLGSSAVMAAGTVVSRLTGFVRAAVIAAAIGLVGPAADAFNIPNAVPNMIYILVGGGVLNSVLVPAMVRAIKADADGGEAYSQRLFSLVVTVIGLATVAAVIAAPWLIRLIVNDAYLDPANREYFDNMVMFARFCLPQIFFYGLYVLIGQMLNAHGRFGPMMWSPVLNNVVAIAVFGAYIAAFGRQSSTQPEPFSSTEVLLLGVGSTLGVAVQALALVPVLRRTGFRIRFRTDWRGAGLGTAGRLGLWTVAFVLLNQVAYLFVINTSSGSSAADTGAAGYTVYANAMLIMMVPHAVITVSLATALLPRLADHAADDNLSLVRDRLVSAIRICLAVMVPVAALLAALAIPLAALLFDRGAAAGETDVLAWTLIALLPGLIGFTVHYLVLRGFYALQDTRTPFFVQISVAGIIVGGALLIGALAGAGWVTILLGVGYSLAYVVGSSISMAVLGRRIGGMGQGALALHIMWLIVPSGIAAGASYGLVRVLGGPVEPLPGWLANLILLAVAGTVGLITFVGLAWLMRIREVREAVTMVARRLRPQRAGTRPSMEARRDPEPGGDAGGEDPRSAPGGP